MHRTSSRICTNVQEDVLCIGHMAGKGCIWVVEQEDMRCMGGYSVDRPAHRGMDRKISTYRGYGQEDI